MNGSNNYGGLVATGGTQEGPQRIRKITQDEAKAVIEEDLEEILDDVDSDIINRFRNNWYFINIPTGAYPIKIDRSGIYATHSMFVEHGIRWTEVNDPRNTFCVGSQTPF